MRLPIIPATPRCLVTNQSYLVYITMFACQDCGVSPTAGPQEEMQRMLDALAQVLLGVLKGEKSRDWQGCWRTWGHPHWVLSNL